MVERPEGGQPTTDRSELGTRKPIPISREQLEQVARTMGPESASARALAGARDHGGPVRFYRDGDRVLIEKLPEGSVEAGPISEAEREHIRADTRSRRRRHRPV